MTPICSPDPVSISDVIVLASYDMFQQLIYWTDEKSNPSIRTLYLYFTNTRPWYKVGSTFLMECVVFEHDVKTVFTLDV